MSKNSNQQRHQALKEWDMFMENEYPSYKERKKKSKAKPVQFANPEDEDLMDFYDGRF